MNINVKQNEDGTEWTVTNERTGLTVYIDKCSTGYEVTGNKRDSGPPWEYYAVTIAFCDEFTDALDSAYSAVDDELF